MAAGSPEFLAYVLEQLAPLEDVSSARFFGGYGLKSQGVLFAMIMDGALYFAADEALRARLAAQGSRPFSYATKKKRVEVKRFWSAPAETLDDGELLLALARAARIAAHRTAPLPRKKRRPRSGAPQHA